MEFPFIRRYVTTYYPKPHYFQMIQKIKKRPKKPTEATSLSEGGLTARGLKQPGKDTYCRECLLGHALKYKASVAAAAAACMHALN